MAVKKMSFEEKLARLEEIVAQMEAGERALLNQYHALVYEKISPYLDEEEKSWLKEVTRAI